MRICDGCLHILRHGDQEPCFGCVNGSKFEPCTESEPCNCEQSQKLQSKVEKLKEENMVLNHKVNGYQKLLKNAKKAFDNISKILKRIHEMEGKNEV